MEVTLEGVNYLLRLHLLRDQTLNFPLKRLLLDLHAVDCSGNFFLVLVDLHL